MMATKKKSEWKERRNNATKKVCGEKPVKRRRQSHANSRHLGYVLYRAVVRPPFRRRRHSSADRCQRALGAHRRHGRDQRRDRRTLQASWWNSLGIRRRSHWRPHSRRRSSSRPPSVCMPLVQVDLHVGRVRHGRMLLPLKWRLTHRHGVPRILPLVLLHLGHVGDARRVRHRHRIMLVLLLLSVRLGLGLGLGLSVSLRGLRLHGLCLRSLSGLRLRLRRLSGLHLRLRLHLRLGLGLCLGLCLYMSLLARPATRLMRPGVCRLHHRRHRTRRRRRLARNRRRHCGQGRPVDNSRLSRHGSSHRHCRRRKRRRRHVRDLRRRRNAFHSLDKHRFGLFGRRRSRRCAACRRRRCWCRQRSVGQRRHRRRCRGQRRRFAWRRRARLHSRRHNAAGAVAASVGRCRSLLRRLGWYVGGGRLGDSRGNQTRGSRRRRRRRRRTLPWRRYKRCHGVRRRRRGRGTASRRRQGRSGRRRRRDWHRTATTTTLGTRSGSRWWQRRRKNDCRWVRRCKSGLEDRRANLCIHRRRRLRDVDAHAKPSRFSVFGTTARPTASQGPMAPTTCGGSGQRANPVRCPLGTAQQRARLLGLGSWLPHRRPLQRHRWRRQQSRRRQRRRRQCDRRTGQHRRRCRHGHRGWC
ncbi:hypothetical protein BU14_0477s0001 [Porphyra umbilicalis]|uniref:Uncharacterized protein n=1 Tax=Porphyra umbilicalis TaxID=2786 RepID=A0A1X6NTW1_PORUM|nr:hypothetical protein BU14_0477s0001 [Porphyra umbilicalis]|eukprot:OSX72044.1 hypothetical protein BU14_0477s0001 [Porphyra umbilicalis]